MAFAIGFICGAAFMLGMIMIIGSIEWETTYTVEKDKSNEDERRG